MALMSLEQWQVEQRLQALHLTLEAGELMGIIGPNGAGKSSLLKSLIGELPGHGQALFEGKPLKQLAPDARARAIGYLPQNHNSQWRLSVRDVVSLGRLPWRDEQPAAIEQALRACDLLSFSQRPVAELSGGEQARVWLARVLAGHPTLLLADEPIASLDLLHQRTVMQLLREHAQGPRAALVTLHDLSLAARFCDRLCLLAKGRLIACGTPREVLTPEHLHQAFAVEVYIDLDAQPPIVQVA